MSEAPGDPLSGRALGDFVVEAKIGEGGFGAIYRAVQPSLDREAVVKILRGRHRGSDSAVERFLAEARLASQLEHPYAAHVYAFGAEDDGLLWIAMELVRGTPLRDLVGVRGPLSLEALAPLFQHICEVVHTAHAAGIVHRDLKPHNIMVISRAGKTLPKLLDFGIAKAASQLPAGGNGSPAMAGRVFGSPHYMAPEQWVDAGGVDHRADIYALGVIAFELLSGEPPFGGDSIRDIAIGHARREVPELPPEIPGDVHAAIARAMAKRAADRFDSALELAAAITRAAGLDFERAELPRLVGSIRDRAIGRAPQPIADAVVALEAARNADQARAAVREIAATCAHVVGVIAVAAHSRSARETLAPVAADRIRALQRGHLRPAEWLELARALCRPMADRADAFVIPELIDAVEHPAWGEALGDEGGSLAGDVAAAGRLLEALAGLDHYPLVVAHADRGERWMGARRAQQAAVELGDRVARLRRDGAGGQPMICDANDQPLLSLWPLAQCDAPTPGAPAEIFWVRGKGRSGAQLVAHPAGFLRHDAELFDWLRELLGPDTIVGDKAGIERAPYLGLATFSPDDAAMFYGRERETEAFLNRLRIHPIAAVVGPSGAGKSSFVQAGVIPELPDGWGAVTFRPGTAPLKALDGALASADAETPVVVVDQLEELFTLCRDDVERQRFAARLVELADRGDARVIATLRDDFLARAQKLPALRDRLTPGLQLLGTPAKADLIRILVEPARRAGYELDDPELAAEMADAVARETGALPLLAFTAARLWERRDRHFKTLTREAYEELGGVGGALAGHAEATLAGLTGEQQATARIAFRHLVTAEGTRAVLTRGELVEVLGDDRGPEVIEALINARLLAASEGFEGTENIEVVHEALLSAWPTLVRWQAEDHEGARLRDQLRAAARQWDERGRDRGLLWRGDALAEYQRWHRRFGGELTELERAFARSSVDDAARGRRIRRGLWATAFAGLAIALVIVLWLARRADTQRDIAEAQRAVAEDAVATADNRLRVLYEEQGRQALLAGAPGAMVYLAEAYRRGADSEALRLMLSLAARAVEAEIAALEHGGRLRAVDVSADGTRAITAAEDGKVRIWDLERHALAATFEHGGDVWIARWRGDGRAVVSAGRDHTARLWDVETGRELARFSGHGEMIYSARFFGERLVTASKDKTARIWDAASGELVAVLEHGDLVFDAVPSPDGSRIATAAVDGGRLWTAGGRLIARLPHAGPVVTASFSPDGSKLATASWDGSARIWDGATGAPIVGLEGHTSRVESAVFSADGKRLVTASRDKTAKVWNAATGALEASLVGHAQALNHARFDPSGRRVVTASWDSTAKIWDADSGTMLASLDGHAASNVHDARFYAGGERVVTISWDHSARLWSARPTAIRARLEGHTAGLMDLALSGDGARIATASMDATARTWRAGGAAEHVLRGHQAPIYRVRFSPDGRRLVTAAADKTARVWDAASGAQLAVLRAHDGDLTAAAFSPDGARIATTGDDGKLAVFDASSYERLAITQAHEGPIFGTWVWTDLFLPDGRIATAGVDTAARLWSPSLEPGLTLRGHTMLLTDLAASPDGRFVITASFDKTARIWDAETGEARAVLEGERGVLNTAQLSPSGERVVTAGEDGVARIWSVPDGALLGSLDHGRTLFFAAYSPDGGLVATASDDHSVKLWDAASSRLIAVLEGHAGAVIKLGFSRDGRELISAGRDGAATIWDVGGERRSPAEIESLVRCRVPFELRDGRLIPVQLPECPGVRDSGIH